MLTHLWEFLNPHKADVENDDLSVSDGPDPVKLRFEGPSRPARTPTVSSSVVEAPPGTLRTVFVHNHVCDPLTLSQGHQTLIQTLI